jgi:hypothetical protein
LFIKSIFIFLLFSISTNAESKIGDNFIDILSNNSIRNSPIPNLPPIYIIHNKTHLTCYPIKLIKKKFHKDRVEYYCINSNIKISTTKIVDDIDREHGQVETERLINEVKDKVDQGNKYRVDILLSDANNRWASFFIKQALKEKSKLFKIIDSFLPTKYYISFRPQFANDIKQSCMKYRDGFSRG